MKKLFTWLQANKISLNTNKTEIVIFRPKHKPLYKSLNFRVSGQKIELSNSVKYLGLHLDAHLDWKFHIDILRTKLSRATGLLAKTRHYITKETLRSIYFALFHSHMTYGCQMWGQSETKIKRLSQLQDRAIRIINHQDNNYDVNPLYNISKILRLPELITFINTMFVYDSRKNN